MRGRLARLVALCLLLGSAGAAYAQQGLAAQPILRFGHIFCAQENADELDFIVDAPNALQRDTAIQIAVYFGKCSGPFPFSFAITNLQERKSPGGQRYACFDRLDPRDGTVAERSCAMLAHVGTIGSELKGRKGDFEIASEEAGQVRAQCREGGEVLVIRQAASWYRASLLFAQRPEPLARPVAPDLQRALRDGCLGVDYLGK